MIIFNEERRNYYLAKKRELSRQNEEAKVIQEDALFIYHYGMIAFLELFPEAKELGISWHRAVIKELQRLETKRLGNLLSGIYSATGATKDKRIFRKFKKIIKDLVK